MLGCMHALLLAGPSTQQINNEGSTALQWAEQWAELKGLPNTAKLFEMIERKQPANAELLRQYAAPPQPAATSPAELASPASLPLDIYTSAWNGELRKVVEWLRKGGPVDALYSAQTEDGRPSTIFAALLHAAAANGRPEMVRELLKRGASVDLPSSHGATALMDAAYLGHLSILTLLLQHSASLDLQANSGGTALMMAAAKGQEACVQALLRAKANTELLDEQGRTARQWAEGKGHMAIAELIRQHSAPPQPAATSPAAPPEAGVPAVTSLASLPFEIFESAERGELQKVVKWLGNGGPVDALCSVRTADGRTTTVSLLHTAAAKGHLEMVKELLKRGASVDLPSSDGSTALMSAAYLGHLSILSLLLQHSADPDLHTNKNGTALMMAATTGQEACVQALLLAKANIDGRDEDGRTALMMAAGFGPEACVQALLRATADTELLDHSGRTALQWAELIHRAQGPVIAKLIRRHASCLSFGLGLALCAVSPLIWPWVVLSVVLGAMATLAFSRVVILTAGPDQHRAARADQCGHQPGLRQPAEPLGRRRGSARGLCLC